MATSLWSSVKSFASSRNLSIQWIDVGDFYYLKAIDGLFAIETMLPKDGGDDQADFEANFKAKGNVPVGYAPPFAAKTLGTKKLYKRLHGINQELSEGSNNIIFAIPYDWIKITGLEVINGEALDFISMYVLDSTTGTYSTVPNYVLNQFGFNVNISPDHYSYKSEFDADLYRNMQIKVVYNSKSAKTVGINFVLNEVK